MGGCRGFARECPRGLGTLSPVCRFWYTGQKDLPERPGLLPLTAQETSRRGASKVLTPQCPAPPRAASASASLLGSAELVLPSWVTSSRLLDPLCVAFFSPHLRSGESGPCRGGMSWVPALSSLIITGHLCTVCLIAPTAVRGWILSCLVSLSLRARGPQSLKELTGHAS